MISAPSRLRLSSGSKGLLLACLLASACSPKIVPVKKPEPKAEVPVKSEGPRKPVKAEAHTGSIALLLPFELNNLELRSAGLKELEKAALALDYYNGFKMALDSLATDGTNFMLRVFDTQDQDTRVINLARASSVTESDLVVGPVFPSTIRAFGEFSLPGRKLQVSPLAASPPSNFNNPNLVTLNNSIDQHGKGVADYILKNYRPQDVRVILLNTGRADDMKFASPVKKCLLASRTKRFTLIERPNAIGLKEYLSPFLKNVVIAASVEKDFLLPTVSLLYRLSQENYSIELFGHPDWSKVVFMDTEKLRALNTRITSSGMIDYKSSRVADFVKRYHSVYSLDPSEFAFKGFDAGFYFGSLLSKYGPDLRNHLSDSPYSGMQADFNFVYEPLTGFSNTAIKMFGYKGYTFEVIP